MMPTRRSPKQLVMLAGIVATALAVLRLLDQHVAQAGLWFFIGLTLTTGFFHGALDIVLIQREFSGASRLVSVLALYTGSAVLIALVCTRSGWLLVLVLLLMSAWHFGEPYGRWAHGSWNARAWVQRAVVGGAPVMVPVLLAPAALQAVLPMAVALDAAAAFAVWQTLAWIWVGVCLLGLITFRQGLLNKPLLAEVVLVLVLNLLLSPLMAFSLYFGVFHATAHIVRVVAKARQGKRITQGNKRLRMCTQPAGVAIVITSLATLFLLLILFWYLQELPDSAEEHRSLLNWILIALTALTFPHLVLVSRSARWLTKQPATGE